MHNNTCALPVDSRFLVKRMAASMAHTQVVPRQESGYHFSSEHGIGKIWYMAHAKDPWYNHHGSRDEGLFDLPLTKSLVCGRER